MPHLNRDVYSTGMPLNFLGLGAGNQLEYSTQIFFLQHIHLIALGYLFCNPFSIGGGCGVGLGLGWGFGTAFGSKYRSSRMIFQGMEFDSKDQNRSYDSKDSKEVSRNSREV